MAVAYPCVNSLVGTTPQIIFRADQYFDGAAAMTNEPQKRSQLRPCPPTKLSGPLVLGGDVTNFQISPNGQRVVYRADADTDEEFNLYSVQLTANVAIPGDYNGNGVVDAADYTIWRDTLNSTTDLRANGDNSGASAGKIDQADYLFWKSHFGMHGGSGAETVSTVPEPASSVLLLLAGSAACATSFGRFFLDAGRSPSYSRQRLMANF
jgi:hypothetical protein